MSGKGMLIEQGWKVEGGDKRVVIPSLGCRGCKGGKPSSTKAWPRPRSLCHQNCSELETFAWAAHHSPGLPALLPNSHWAPQASSQAFTCPPGGASSVSVVLQQAQRLYELTCWHPVLGQVYLSQAMQYTADG